VTVLGAELMAELERRCTDQADAVAGADQP
jgi:hypothetical protein